MTIGGVTGKMAQEGVSLRHLPQEHEKKMADLTPPITVAVLTESSWWSKTNWTQAVSMASSLLTLAFGYKYTIPVETQLAIVAAIQSIQSIATWIFKTWFTQTVTPASVANATTTTITSSQTPIVHIT